MIGKRLSGRYEILRELGRGGMGVVYLAHDPLLERQVAVKIITSSVLNPEIEERFRREARLVAKLDHPAIVPVHDVGEEENSLFLVMPFVDGTNLRTLMQSGSLKLGDLIEVGIQVAEALDYSHTRNIVHRDIKPENILITPHSDNYRVRITDFGLATASSENRLTQSGAVVGTIAYLSPEQVSGLETDCRADIYALGTVLYECIVGETPFNGEFQSVLYRIAHEAPAPLRARVDVSLELERIIFWCLEKEPGRRPARAKDLAASLSSFRSTLVSEESEKPSLPTSLRETGKYFVPPATPFIGREKELTELQGRLNAAVYGECQFVVIGGETGIGKSRLVEEVEKLAKARKIRTLHGRCFEQDRAFPYAGFCGLIQEYFRNNTSTYESASATVDFSDLAADLVSLFPVLGELPPFRFTSTGDAKTSSSVAKLADRTYIFELFARCLTRMGGGKPLVLFLEDLHQGEVSIEALQYVVRRLGPVASLIIGTFQTNEVDRSHPLTAMLDSFRGDRRFVYMPLPPLTPVEHRTFVKSLTGITQVEDRIAEKLYEATEGNPYFTQELIRSLLDSAGSFKSDAAEPFSGSDLTSTPLPVTVQQTIERRIRKLSEDLRDLLSVASVLGKTFDLDDLESLIDDKDPLEDLIDRLIRHGLLLEEQGSSRMNRLRFSSAIVRDVLYEALPRRRRKMLHLRYAEEMEKRNAGHLERVYPQLLHHYAHADVPPRVVEYGLKFAKKSLQAFSPEDTIRSVKMVLDFGEGLLEGEARTILAAAYRMSGEFDQALEQQQEAVKIFERTRDDNRLAAAVFAAAEMAWQFRKIEETKKWVDRGLEISRATGDAQVRVKLLSLAATVANLRGEYERATEYYADAQRLRSDELQLEDIPRGGKVTVALPIRFGATSPASIRVAEEVEVQSGVFETLLATDSAGNIVPFLCERWDVLENGRAFLLTLRNNVQFHDGRTLTASAVKESFETAILNCGSEVPPAFSVIQGYSEYKSRKSNDVSGLVVISESKLAIRLVEPLPIYPSLLAAMRTEVAAPAAGDNDAVFVGTGPFRVKSFQPDQVLLERNPKYWRGNGALLDFLEFRAVSNPSEIAAGFRAGAFDVAGALLPDDLEAILKDRHLGANLIEAPKKNLYFVIFSARSNLARVPQLREAMIGIVRTHDLVRQSLGRFAQPAEGWIPPGILGHDPNRRKRPLTTEKATEILSSSGLDFPLSMKAVVHPFLQERYASLTAALSSLWSSLGINLVIETPNMESYHNRRENNDGIDLMIGRWVADYDDPDDFTYGFFHSMNGRLRNFFYATQLDELLESGRHEIRQPARERIYRRIESTILESNYLLPLLHDIDYRLTAPRIRNLALRSSPPYVNYADVSKLPKPADSPVKQNRGGIIQVPLVAEVNSLDPSLTFFVWQSEIIPAVFETLMRQTDGAQIAPWLASSFQAEEGGRRFRFILRDQVRFHDGRPLTSRDVRYSFERLLTNSNSPKRSMLQPILGARALMQGERSDLQGFRIESAREFTVELEDPVSFFPALLTFPSTAIVPEGLDRFGCSWKEGCVGTGPFRISRFMEGERLELDSNPYYWKSGLPKSDGLVFTFGVSPSEIYSGFRTGRFSLAWDLLPTDIDALRRQTDFASIYGESPRLSTYYMAFNIYNGPLRDPDIRHRLINSIPVDGLVRKTMGALAIPARGLIPPGLPGFEYERKTRRHAPTVASESIELKCLVHSIYDGPFSPFALALFQMMEQAGFRIKVIDRKTERYYPKPADIDFDLNRWIADYPDSDNFVESLLHSGKGLFAGFSSLPEIDRLLERGRVESDAHARDDLYREIQSIIAENALMLPLFHEQAYAFARPEVQDFEVHFSAPVVPYERLWKKQN